MNKDVKQLLQRAEAQGFEWSRSKGGHIRVKCPDGTLIFDTMTHLDPRGFRNFRQRMRARASRGSARIASMSGSERIDHAVSIVDQHMASAPVDVRVAWQTCRGAARRARRISSTTLPALAEAAQLAIIVRDAVRGLGQAIHTPPVALGYLLTLQERALVHAEQLTTLFRTGGGSEPPPPE